jgi:hypothetical protein
LEPADLNEMVTTLAADRYQLFAGQACASGSRSIPPWKRRPLIKN